MSPVTGAISPLQARAERIRRERARRDLIAYSQYVSRWYQPAAHHHLVARYLQQVADFIESDGKAGIGRLMIFEPPRHGKTEQAAQKFPGWLMGRNPDLRVILTAYGASLAQKSSRAIRTDVTSAAFRAVFGDRSAVDAPVQMADDSRSVAAWDFAAPHRGGLVAAGIGGGITGQGANLGIIDDPYKDRDEAESEDYQEKVMTWYGSSFYTRLEPNAAVVLMHTRWAPSDQAGRLLKTMLQGPLSDKWTVLCLPALAYQPEELAENAEHQAKEIGAGLWLDTADPLGRQPGEPLWPEKFDAEALARIKANLDEANPLDWPALYQQQPRPAGGVFFERDQFGIVDANQVPEGLLWVRYVDLALSTKQTADFNATVAMAMAKDGTVFLRDMIRVRGWPEFKERLISAMLDGNEKGVVWAIEVVAFQALVFQEFIADKRLANVAIQAIRPEGDKVQRARPFQTRAAAGKVKLVRGTWTAAFISEVVEFPTGAHDDQVDTASGGLALISGGSTAASIIEHYRQRALALNPKAEGEIAEVAHA